MKEQLNKEGSIRKPLRVLLIDDDPDIRKLIIRELEEEFQILNVTEIINAERFSQSLDKGNFDLVITDYHIHWTDGLSVVNTIKDRYPNIPVIMFTGTGGEEIAVEAMKAGLDDYIIKSHKHFKRLSASVKSVLKLSEEIALRENAYREIKNLKQQLEFILGVTKTGLDIIDSNFNIRYIDPEWQKVYGDPTGQKCYKYFMDRNEICPDCGMIKALKTKKIAVTEEILVKEGGRHIQVTSIPFQDDKGELLVAEVNVDITERKRAEEKLKTSYGQLRNLANHLQNIREEERTHIAREIHDEFGQVLTALKIDLSWLGKRLFKNQKPLLEKTKSMSKLVDMTVKTMRRISTELRPGILDDLGLVAAIEWLTGEFRKHSGIKVGIKLDRDIDASKELSTTIFRILQEALTNVYRHSNATKVGVSLLKKDDNLILEIKDNGKGITQKQISDHKSLGLIGIRERVYSYNGSVEIQGVKGKRTTVTVIIPLGK